MSDKLNFRQEIILKLVNNGRYLESLNKKFGFDDNQVARHIVGLADSIATKDIYT